MTEVEVLTQQITALEPVILEWKYILSAWYIGLFASLLGGLLLVIFFEKEKHTALFFLGIVLIFVSILSVVATIELQLNSPVEERKELEKQRSDAVKSEIKALSCEDLRLDILNKLEDDNMDYYLKEHDEFEREYYYHKCEIPLREEVMRLRGVD